MRSNRAFSILKFAFPGETFLEGKPEALEAKKGEWERERERQRQVRELIAEKAVTTSNGTYVRQWTRSVAWSKGYGGHYSEFRLIYWLVGWFVYLYIYICGWTELMQDLEEALLTHTVEEVGSSLIQDLIVRLLKGCFNSNKDEITSSNYQMYLRRLFRIKCEVKNWTTATT